MAPRRDHCPCLTVPRTSQEGHLPAHCPFQLVPQGGLEKAPEYLTGLKVPHSLPGRLPHLLFLRTPHPSVGSALRHRGEGRLRTFPGQSSEAWVETDQKVVVNVACVSVDFATSRNPEHLEPPQACLPTEPPSQVRGEVAGSPRGARGGGAVGAAPLRAPVPPALPLSAATGPTSQGRVGRPLGREFPGPAPQQPQPPRRKSRRTRGGRSAPGCAGCRSRRRSGAPPPRALPTAAPGCTGRRPAPNFGDGKPGERGPRGRETCPRVLAPARGGVAGLPGWPGHPPAQREVPGELGEAAGAGPALRGRDLGAGNGEERARILVCAAQASPGREFDFRVWPQVGQGEHKAREKSPRSAGAAARSLFARGAPPSCSTLFL